jgi:hypothetical protein
MFIFSIAEHIDAFVVDMSSARLLSLGCYFAQLSLFLESA